MTQFDLGVLTALTMVIERLGDLQGSDSEICKEVVKIKHDLEEELTKSKYKSRSGE